MWNRERIENALLWLWAVTIAAAVLLPTVSVAGEATDGERCARTNVEHVAKWALAAALATSTDVEYGGVVYSPPGQPTVFCYTLPQTSGDRRSLSFSVRVPKGSHVEALYHTHPAVDEASMFSDADVRIACDMGRPSYIATAGREVFVFWPMPRACFYAGKRGAHVGRGLGRLA